ncbi:uroporphyrinogen decarboxylase [Marinoscillum furvescens]|uniref:Uroporphyrinogen decarboxylase n=1 Tax=Marinoscillum furvescens DSM 4134 TaxID=1122208 RepID=A0A3D9L3K8_MARFU|nr:uroporphyrinogen decarboxylase [Marinoscillum furvescens]RED99780.1 uroporphyrinogen decarboxylase [Marinoscillum furvescens DSM 4134]
MLENDLILRAARGEKTERTPVWLMRQAGRILPEYRAVRNSLSGFKELVETPELAAEVTIQPVDLLGVDAAIIFSDILVIPEAMGLTYEMVEKKGPHFPSTIQSTADLKSLRIATPEDLSYTIEAIKITKKELKGRVPVIGFAGAPWTIFSYMVEGGGSKTFSKARKMLYTAPELAHELLDMITKSTISYLKAQIAAGADMVQIFDSWAGVLGPEQYRTYSLQYIEKIAAAITEVPVTVFAKGAYFALKDMQKVSCNTVGLDWNMDVAEARHLLPNKTLQGNLDPCALYGSYSEVEAETKKMLDQFVGHHHIANLGHGVYPDTDPDKVKCFIEAVKSYSAS